MEEIAKEVIGDAEQQHELQNVVDQSNIEVSPNIRATVEQQQYIVQSVTPLPLVQKVHTGGNLQTSAPTPRKATGSRQHKSYTVGYKLQVLDWYYANGKNKYQAASHFGLDRKRIRDWLDNEDRYRTEPLGNRRKRSSAPGCPPYYKNLDDALAEWYSEQRALGAPVSNRELKDKALELAPQLGITENFKASQSYIASWKRRTGNEDETTHDISNDAESDGDQPTMSEGMLSSDFEKHLRQLERAGVGLTGEGSMDAYTSVSDAIQANFSATKNASLGTGNSEDTHGHGVGQPITQQLQVSVHSLAEKLSEHEQWISIVQQTVESLEADMTSKIAQMKLVLQQLKTSVCETGAQLRDAQILGSKRAIMDGSITPQSRKLRKV